MPIERVNLVASSRLLDFSQQCKGIVCHNKTTARYQANPDFLTASINVESSKGEFLGHQAFRDQATFTTDIVIGVSISWGVLP